MSYNVYCRAQINPETGVMERPVMTGEMRRVINAQLSNFGSHLDQLSQISRGRCNKLEAMIF